MKKKPNYRARLVFLYVGSFLISIAPLVICFAFNWGDYTKTPGDTVRLTLGGIVLATLVFMKVIGKLKMPRRIVSFGIAFVLAYLLQSMIQDLLLLTGMALLGEFIDFIFFQGTIKKTKENMIVEKTAEVTTAQVEEVIKKYVGRI